MKKVLVQNYIYKKQMRFPKQKFNFILLNLLITCHIVKFYLQLHPQMRNKLVEADIRITDDPHQTENKNKHHIKIIK